MLASYQVRTSKVRRIMYRMLRIARRACQFEIEARLVQQRDGCPCPEPLALLHLLHRFLVRLIDGHLLLAKFHVAVFNRIIKISMAALGPGVSTLSGISSGGGSGTGRDMAIQCF